ncbi:toxin-antitoxin system, toxin component [Streptomyces sp. NBC_00249]|uniref:toxin-antitoxin system, toxin component n=1 Tax=Streptomyces sp. NBC_00249 TaxID=2975690 RepID=UPI002251ADA5|nr:toxin-antitoxin system, toxin component [Streptomyces sp. NBC_00249]MCX5193445.1 toxin-antitoxin system, toxin component [Streptomyces sp. NBC_00249]
MRTTRAMRRLGADLLAHAHVAPPGGAAEIIGGVCAAFGRRAGGRPVEARFAPFPPDTASGLWLKLDDRDLLVIEARTRPEHQLVIACHELWHVAEGSCDSHGPGMAVAARLTGPRGSLTELLRSDSGLDAVVRRAAARADLGDPAEIRAETFGLHLGKILKTLLPPPRQERFPEEIERIKTSLGWSR